MHGSRPLRRPRTHLLVLAGLLMFWVAGCDAATPTDHASNVPATSGAASSLVGDSVHPSQPIGSTALRSPSAAGPGRADVLLPNKRLTPGAAFPAATAAQVCVSGYSASVRDVPQATRLAVFAAYGIPYANHAAYELDHLVSLELGGDNSAANLWPELLDGATGAHVKDVLENRLHELVCSKKLDLVVAQQAIAGDWWTAMQRYAPTGLPATGSVTSPVPTAAPPSSAGTYYANCAAARSAGVAPLHRGQPGYRAGLDGDGNGIACTS